MTSVQNRPHRAGRSKLRALLPETAQAVVWEGKKFVALPEQEVDGWLEDLVDGIEATLALRENGVRLSQDDVKKTLRSGVTVRHELSHRIRARRNRAP